MTLAGKVWPQLVLRQSRPNPTAASQQNANMVVWQLVTGNCIQIEFELKIKTKTSTNEKRKITHIGIVHVQ